MSEEELKEKIRAVCKILYESVGEFQYVDPMDQAYTAVRVREAFEKVFGLNK